MSVAKVYCNCGRVMKVLSFSQWITVKIYHYKEVKTPIGYICPICCIIKLDEKYKTYFIR